MQLFLPISLFLSSSLAVFLVGCSPVSGYKNLGKIRVTEQLLNPVIDRQHSLQYKAKIDMYSSHFSGIVILKQTNDSTAHVTFITEIGMKMFDYEIKRDNFNLQYVFEPLKDPRLLKVLESDLRLILLKDLLYNEATTFEKKDHRIYLVKKNRRYYYKVKGHEMEKITVRGAVFTKENVNYLCSRGQPEKIRLKHSGFLRLRIQLERITENK